MAVTYTWSVENTESNVADGGITVIHWRCTGVEGDNSASVYGTTGHTYDADADDFVAYDSVTEQNCIDWAKADLDVDAIEAGIAAQIAELATPTTTTGTPWAAE